MIGLMIIAGGILVLAAIGSMAKVLGGPHGISIDKDGKFREF